MARYKDPLFLLMSDLCSWIRGLRFLPIINRIFYIRPVLYTSL